jgi:hypothetical protein
VSSLFAASLRDAKIKRSTRIPEDKLSGRKAQGTCAVTSPSAHAAFAHEGQAAIGSKTKLMLGVTLSRVESDS